MLVEEDDLTEDVEVVIGAVESNQANNKAADELEAALGVKAKEPAAALLGFWRTLSALAATGVDKPTFNITVAHRTDRPESITHSTSVRTSRATPHLVSEQADFGPFL